MTNNPSVLFTNIFKRFIELIPSGFGIFPGFDLITDNRASVSCISIKQVSVDDVCQFPKI